MNRFTLRFKDDKVEMQFQKSREKIKQKALQRYAPLGCLITMLILINSITKQSVSISIFCSIFLVMQMIAYYLIHREGFARKLQPIAISIIQSMSTLLQIVAIMEDSATHTDVDWILDISILLSINYVLSTDISWNLFFFFLNLAIRLYIRYSESDHFSILSIAFIICSLISFYNEYLRIFNLRSEFMLEEENTSSQNIFDSFQEKSIIILKYDQELMNFKLKFQNNCSIHYFSQFTSDFLSKMTIEQSNLGKAIFQSIQTKEYSKQKFVVGKFQKGYYNITYQVTKSTEFQIFIIITKKQSLKPRLVKPIFYKELLMKVKKIDKKLFHKEILKNMMYCLMNSQGKVLKFQLYDIKPQNLLSFFQERFNEARVICHVVDSIKNNLIMIDGVVLLIKKTFKVRQCTILKSAPDLLTIQLDGYQLKQNISNSQKELLELILLRIGTGKCFQDEFTINLEIVDFTNLYSFR